MREEWKAASRKMRHVQTVNASGGRPLQWPLPGALPVSARGTNKAGDMSQQIVD